MIQIPIANTEDGSNFHSAKIFIETLVNANNENSKTDSRYENQPTILSSNHLLGSSFLQINTSSGRLIRRDKEKLIHKNEKINNCQPTATKQRKTNKYHAKNWHHSYIPSHNEFLGNFKLLLQIKLTHQQRYSKLSLQMISCNTRIESIYYEKLKRSHNFDIDVGTRNAFYYFT